MRHVLAALGLVACCAFAGRAAAQSAGDRLAVPDPVDASGRAAAPGYEVFQVQLRSPAPLGVTLRATDAHLAAASALSCTTDCVLPVFRGRYRLAPKTIRELDQSPRAWSEPFDIASAGTLHVRFDDHSELRIAGVLTLLGTVLTAGGIIAGAVLRALIEPWTNPDETAGLLITAGAIAAVGFGVGVSLAFSGDGLEVRFEPAAAAPRRR